MKPAAIAIKMQLYTASVELCTRWCLNSSVPTPRFVIDSTIKHAGEYDTRTGTVHTSIARCQVPTVNPGHSWSFPGYKADRTTYGVPPHEVGHHVHAHLLRSIDVANLDIRDWKQEAPVSGYEPDRKERIAEAIRLFITNPNLLKLGRPIRWETLTTTWGLRPLHNSPWQNVLGMFDAHERYYSAAENWIKRRK